MPKTILIALDYAPSSKTIAQMGYELAKGMRAEICLLHVISDASYYSSVSYSPDFGVSGFPTGVSVPPLQASELRNTAERFLEDSKKQMGNNVPITTLIKEGNPADEILEAAKALPAHIVVMGTHGRRGLDKILMGSVAEKVMHHASLPLFIIPTGTTSDSCC